MPLVGVTEVTDEQLCELGFIRAGPGLTLSHGVFYIIGWDAFKALAKHIAARNPPDLNAVTYMVGMAYREHVHHECTAVAFDRNIVVAGWDDEGGDSVKDVEFCEIRGDYECEGLDVVKCDIDLISRYSKAERLANDLRYEASAERLRKFRDIAGGPPHSTDEATALLARAARGEASTDLAECLALLAIDVAAAAPPPALP